MESEAANEDGEGDNSETQTDLVKEDEKEEVRTKEPVEVSVKEIPESAKLDILRWCTRAVYFKRKSGRNYKVVFNGRSYGGYSKEISVKTKKKVKAETGSWYRISVKISGKTRTGYIKKSNIKLIK